MHAIPEIDGKPLNAGTTRQDQYVNSKQPAPYVDLDAGGYLLEELFNAGPDKPAAMGGSIPLTSQDVWYHCLNTGVQWEPWERQTIVRMSQGYCAARQMGKDAFAISPVDQG